MTKTTTAATDLSNISFAWDNLLETTQIPVKRLFVFDTNTNAWVQLPEGNTSVDEFNNTLIYNGFVGELNNTRFMIAQGESELTLTADFDAINWCSGFVSGMQSFSVEGKNLTNPITVAAPTNFEISLIPQGPFATSIAISPIATNVTPTVIYIRVANDAIAAGTFDIMASSPDTFYTLISETTPITSIADAQDPTIVAPADMAVAANASCGAIIANLGNTVTSDNCGVANVTNDAPSPFPLGTTTVTWTVTDNAGNTATALQEVVVTDTTLPTITAPADITTTADANCEATSVALGTPVTADNCGVDIVTNNGPTNFPLGTTTVLWTVTDNAGNLETATQTVVVNDTENPVVTAPADVIVSGNAGCTAINLALGTPTVADNCSIASVSNSGLATYPLGTTLVTWTVTDTSGNETLVTQNVTVNDTTNPTIVAPADMAVSANASCGAIIANLGNTVTSDNCGVANVTNDAPSPFPLGTTTVTWTVTDNAGNTATALQEVVVTDTTLPTITAPADITTTADANCEATSVALGTPVTADNCGVDTVTNNAPTNFPLGTTTVLWTVTDNAGNSQTATQTITVENNTPPTVTAPAAISTTTNNSCNALNVVLGTPVISGTCSAVSTTNDAPIAFPLGTTVVTWTVSDTAGNSTKVTQNVTVEDTTAPQAITRDFTVLLDANGTVEITADMINNGSLDNCSIASMTIDIANFDCTNLGANIVTLTVTDPSGNSAENISIVTVLDTIKPIVTTQDITVALDENGFAAISAADINNNSFESCAVTMRLSKSDFNCADLGENTVLLTVTDSSGNNATAAANVTIVDTMSPVIATQNITIALDDTGKANITTQDIDLGSFDNCDELRTELAQYNFGCADEGTNEVLYTLTDGSGNTTTAIIIITVENNAVDTNGDGVKDNCSLDDDNDGNGDDGDNCPFENNPDQNDNDLDGKGDLCDDDDDNDGILDTVDNCPFTYNPRQEDRNNNGIGDVCDVININVSEVLSPNGDNVNDYWMVYNIENYPDNKVSVYNRSGGLVFVARSYNNTWDGHYQNNRNPLPEASYFYQIDLDGDGSVDSEGWIYLTR